MRRRAAGLWAVGAAASALIAALVLTGPAGHMGMARAETTRHGGFSARVDGHRGWFGSYAMAGIGTVWCVDHGTAAPDSDHGYLPSPLAGTSEATRTALAWALGRHGQDPDRVTAAALTLVLHDLMGGRYPSGPLDVDRLTPARMAGFEGHEEQVVARARAIKADSLAHRHLRQPFSLAVHAEPARPGQRGYLVARLADAAGTGVSGVPLFAEAKGAAIGPGGGLTDDNGEQRFSFVAARGENRFHVRGTVPELDLRSFVSSVAKAQRVARGGQVAVSAGTTFVAEVRRLSVRKTVDRAAYLPPAGARFGVRPVHGGGASSPAAELVTDAHGRTASLDLDPGVYEVVETEAPAGYAPAGPWRVDLTAGDAVLEASNTALWGAARIAKVDAASRRPVAGARLALAYDADRDGSFETPLTPLLSAGQPETRQLPPGDYELRETAAPPGYRLSQRPVRFSVAPGRLTPVEVANSPLPPSPAKRPVGPVGPTPDRTSAERGPPRGPLPSTENELLGLAAAGWALVMSGAVLTAGARPSTRRARRRAELLRPRAGRPLPR